MWLNQNVKMSSIYEIPAQEYNSKLAAKLKEMAEFPIPEWSLYVKSGVCKSRPPMEVDFWHKRAASILRQIYIHNVVGVQRLRGRYGGRKIRGSKPEIFKKSSGKMIRVMLQQAEKAGLLEKVKEGKRFGRKLTKSGKDFLEAIK